MTKKTYFKGNKKSVKPKKYQFAGFDEAMQIDNTGYLNKLYNPNYYGSQQDSTAQNQEATKAIEAQKVMSYDVAKNVETAKQDYENYTKALADQQKQVADQQKQIQEESKQQAQAQLAQNLSSIGKEGTDLLVNTTKNILAERTANATAATAAMQAGQAGVWAPIASTATTAAPSAVASGIQMGAAYVPSASNAITAGTSLLPGAVEVGNTANAIGQAAAGTANATNAANAIGTGASTAAGLSSAAYAGIGAAGTIAGEIWKYKSNDQDPSTYRKGERAGTIGGTILSRAGTGAGLGTMIMPGIGTAIGAGVGALAGTVEGLIKNKKQKKQAADIQNQMASDRAAWQAEQDRNRAAYDKAIRYMDYTKRRISENIGVQNELMRQNRLQDLTESQLSGNTSIVKTGGKRNYFGKGGVSVPGGQIVPIGGGAVEFVGRKHAQGGILLDPQTEVEGGETMDQVAMNEYKGGGKMNDYFFSAYLKLGGKSFAQRHKELIKSGAGQAAIQDLARKQEEVAYKNGEKDRSPKQIAKYGGVRQYAPGGPKDDTVSMAEWKAMDKNQRYKLVYDLAAKAGDPMPEVTAAQWAIESDFGRAMTGTWNFFGQTTKSKDSTNLATPRDPSGGSKRFKNYESLEDSVADHVNRWSPKYKDAKNPEEALMMLENYGGKGRYAEGYPTKEFPEGDWKAYVKNTNSIIKQYDPVVKAKPAAAAQAQAQVDGQPMSAAEYQRLTAGRPPLPSGAVQSTSSPIDYALLGTGLGIARGTGALAGFVGGAARDIIGNATRPTPGTVTPGAELVRMPQTGTGVTPFAPSGPNWVFYKPGVGGQATTQGGKFPLMAPVKESVGKLPDVATAQRAGEFTPTMTTIDPATGQTIEVGDASMMGPFEGDPRERLPVPDKIQSRGQDVRLEKGKPKEPTLNRNTGLASRPEFNPMYTKQQIKNARRLAAFGFLSQLAAPTAGLFMKPKLVGAPQTITPALLDAAMAAKAVGPMVTPGTVAAQRLGRIAPQTDNILNTNAATKQFMANMGDPSAMVGMIASDTRAAEAERKEMQRAQEINTQLASEEGKIKLQASMANQDASMQSQIANQRNINEAQNRYFDVLSRNQAAQNQAYITNAENKLRADLANADLRAAKQNRDIAALSVMGSNIAGGVGDIFSYASEEAKARINAGETGVYDRNFNSLFLGKTGGAKKKMYGGTNSYTSRLGDLKYKRALKVK